MRHPGSTLPKNWDRDREFADRIYRRIEQMIADGAETNVIAEMVGCSYRTVHRFRLHGRPRPNHGSITDDEIRSLLRDGWSGYALLCEYGVKHRRFKRIRDELEEDHADHK